MGPNERKQEQRQKKIEIFHGIGSSLSEQLLAARIWQRYWNYFVF
jgi:hypothetical protein